MLLAKIREIECIGCTKCLDACPVDAIVGSHQFLHTVISSECIGCKLCVPPCPMDCIDLIDMPSISVKERTPKARIRVANKKERLQENKEAQKAFFEQHLHLDSYLKRQEIKEALKRYKLKNDAKKSN
ncbi:MAG: RnfABCDGE type electron transport complex subunit [Francisellaceae bacterium]|nr:RnfABCDGE type electron transport complex subunit [Francisellaceae bacterium]